MSRRESLPATRLQPSDQATAEFRAGFRAGAEGRSTSDCPFPEMSTPRILWLRGHVHQRIRGGVPPTRSWPYAIAPTPWPAR